MPTSDDFRRPSRDAAASPHSPVVAAAILVALCLMAFFGPGDSSALLFGTAAAVGFAFFAASLFPRLRGSWIAPADLLPLSLLLAASAAYAAAKVDFSIPPFEDAAMIMRYAEHFARGEGLVWNVGEPPVDGATDFLLTVGLGTAVACGAAAETAARVAAVGAHHLTIALVFLTLARGKRGNLGFALFAALYLAVGPGFRYAAAYFGTPVFALVALLAWRTALPLFDAEPAGEERANAIPIRAWAFALVALVCGLIRPDGVILMGLLLLAILRERGWRRSLAVLVPFVVVFGVLGGGYFAWRWWYFGYPLPNPFYNKGGGRLHVDGLVNSLLNTAKFTLPILPLYLAAFRSPRSWQFALRAILPVAGFTLVFILISDEMNFGGRFQYVLLPIALAGAGPLARDAVAAWKRLQRSRRGAALPTGWTFAALRPRAASLLVLSWGVGASLAWMHSQSARATYDRDGRYDLGRRLAEWKGKGYVLATTEAGLLPYYSGWRSVDVWGLNDAWIAHHGGVTAEYLAEKRPTVLVFHAKYSPLVSRPAAAKDAWGKMVETLHAFAIKEKYLLAAVYGDSPYDTHYYFVRPDAPDAAALVAAIRDHPYEWSDSGRAAVDFSASASVSAAPSARPAERR